MGLTARQKLKLVSVRKQKQAEQDSALDMRLISLVDSQKVKGDKGPKGDKGDPGARGLPGRDGKDGKNGRDGVDGLRGKDGLNGEDGKDGQDGKTGPMPRHEIKGKRYRFENPDGSWGEWGLAGGSTIQTVGGGGQALSVSQSDRLVIMVADASDATYIYTGELLTGVTFVDTAEITNNSKTLGYDVDDLLETITHVFDYLSQTWTVTTTLSYTSGKLTGKSTTIGKV